MYETRFDDQTVTISQALIDKYDRPGPRYTSYPTAPEWHGGVGETQMQTALAAGNAKGTPLSLYVHLPFCEEHCTFCGCSTVITKKHAVAEIYLKHLLQEIALLAPHVAVKRSVIQIHWGGGTPTYLSCAQIERLMTALRQQFNVAADAEISVEVDPRVTSDEQLQVMRQLGVNRISMGVQDFQSQVQAAINRIQPEDMTRRMIERCRDLNYDSVNADLIYGLPFQTVASFQDTVARLRSMSPDRIALFNFAYVPWIKAQQRAIDPATLPSPSDKFQIFCDAIRQFTDNGYLFVGMDHFAKPNDELSAALRNKTLARNFQGYTTRMGGTDMLSFGITAISDIDGSYIQNKKILTQYYRDIAAGHLAIERGFVCSADDQLRRQIIMELFCNNRLAKNLIPHTVFATELAALQQFMDDGLMTETQDYIEITPLGRLFIRNIGMVFDRYLQKNTTQRFSRTV